MGPIVHNGFEVEVSCYIEQGPDDSVENAAWIEEVACPVGYPYTPPELLQLIGQDALPMCDLRDTVPGLFLRCS